MSWLGVALAVLVTTPTSTSATEAPAPPLRLRADRITVEPGRCEARGAVALETPGLRVNAARIEVDGCGIPDGDIRILAQGVTITPCNCGPRHPPSWTITATRAALDPRRGVDLVWPVFRVRGVPVATVPRGYWPVTTRRSGFLIPTFRTHPALGTELGAPIYFTLGRSWDLTLTPQLRTTRGAAGALEVRNHPTATTKGTLRANLAYDQGVPEAGGGWRGGKGGRARYRVAADQVARWGGQWSMGLDLLGDPAGYEWADTFAARQAEWTVSRLVYSRSTDGIRVSGALQWMQDLRPATYRDVERPLRALSLWTDDRAARQRYAELRLDAARVELGQARLGGLPIAWWASMRASGQGFGDLAGDAGSFFRADARPAVHQDVLLPLGLRLASNVSLRLTTWVSDDVPSATRWAPRWSAQLAQELARSFGAWAHRIRSELAVVYVPFVGGRTRSPFANLDELDALGAVAQLQLRVRSSVSSGASQAWVEAAIGRDLGADDQPGLGLGPLVLAAGAVGGHGPWTTRLSGAATFDDGHRFASLRAHAEVASGATAVGGQLNVVGARPPSAWFVAAEELLPSETLRAQRDAYGTAIAWRAQTAIEAWLRLRLGRAWSLEGRATVSVAERRRDVEAAYPAARFHSILQRARLGAAYTSTCGCWAVRAGGSVDRDLGGLGLQVALTLGSGLRP